MAFLLVAGAAGVGAVFGALTMAGIAELSHCCRGRSCEIDVNSEYDRYVKSLDQARYKVQPFNHNNATVMLPTSPVVAPQVSGLSTVKGWYKDVLDQDKDVLDQDKDVDQDNEKTKVTTLTPVTPLEVVVVDLEAITAKSVKEPTQIQAKSEITTPVTPITPITPPAKKLD